MVTGFDIIGSNKALQEHWVKRFIAAIIDSVIVLVPSWLIFNFIFWATFWGYGWYWWGWVSWFLFGFIAFLYFVVLESAMGASFGKKIMGLKVVSTTQAPVSIGGVFIRNISKIIYLQWLDALIGLFTEGDPRQKYSDRMGDVTVTRTDQGAYMEEQFRQMQYVPPHPQVPPGAFGQPAQPGQPGAPQQAPGQPYQQSAPQGAPTGWGQQQPGTWGPGQQPAGSTWPQHQWDEQGQLRPQTRFCSSCGGQLTPRGDGKMVCVRCGLVY